MLPVVMLVGCGSSGESEHPARGDRLLDERRDRYGAIRLGLSEGRLRKLRGRPVATNADVIAEKLDDVGGPQNMDIPNPEDQSTVGTDRDLLYRDAIVSASAGRVFAFTAFAARTRAGVAVGSELDLVAERYKLVRCDRATYAHGEPAYRYCVVRLKTGRYLYFGDDPIRSITLSSTNVG